MAENFRGPSLKLGRAQEHIIYLNSLLPDFFESHEYEAVPDLNTKPGFVVWTARGKDQFRHDAFSPIIGDIVHNLRDSLDLAMCILMRNAGKPDNGVYFPTGGSVDHFNSAAIGKGSKPPKCRKPPPDFPPGVIDVLETVIQPYEGGASNSSYGPWLWALHRLAILDKHRLIVPTIFGASIVAAQANGGWVPIMVPSSPVPIKNGRILAEFKLADLPPHVELDKNARVTLAIEFDKRVERLRRVNVSDGVYKLLNATEYALNDLATCL